MISWNTQVASLVLVSRWLTARYSIKSLLIFFGPMLLPKVIAFYRSIRAPSNSPPTPVPAPTSRSLNLLFVSIVVFLVSTLPYFAPTNIFAQTASRIQTPTAVLFNRLSGLRPLTQKDEALKQVFGVGGLEARLQYLRFGGDVLAQCPLVEDPKASGADTAFLVCALPSLLRPHLVHFALLGLATAGFVGGQPSARWRTTAVVAGLVLAAADVLAVATYEYARNAHATTGGALDSFFQTRHLVSRLSICICDAALSWLLWASSTNRVFSTPPTASSILDSQTSILETAAARFRALGAVRNVVYRDTGFRDKVDMYWRKEAAVMQEVMEDRDVVAALNEVLTRLDVGAVDGEARRHVDGILGPVLQE